MDSSDANRTVMSAELVLAGFYSSKKRDRWNNEELRWEPVPVHSISESVDNVSRWTFHLTNLVLFLFRLAERGEVLETKHELNFHQNSELSWVLADFEMLRRGYAYRVEINPLRENFNLISVKKINKIFMYLHRT